MNKTIKKITALILTLIISISVLSFASFAVSQVTLKAETVSGNPGETVKIVISISNNTGLSSLKFNVFYDSCLTLTNIDFNSKFGSYVTAPQPYTNPQSVSMISPLSDIKVNGVFATLTFKISSTVTDKYNAKINLKFDPDDVFDSNFNNISLKTIDGCIEITGPATHQSYSVTLNSNDSNGKISKIDVLSNKTVKLPTLQKSGYTCIGWSADKNAVIPSYSCGSEFAPKENTNLYAVWAKNNTKVTGVTVNDISMRYKDVVTLKPDIKATNGAKYLVEWLSSNKEVATVDKNGKITATKRGADTATITCTVTDQFGNTFKDTCKVDVSLSVWQWIKTYIFFGWIWY